jgi:hypothetical protein
MRRLLVSPRRSVVVLTVVALGAVALLAVSSIVVASHELTKSVDKQVRTTAAVSSVVIGQRRDLAAVLARWVPGAANGALT